MQLKKNPPIEIRLRVLSAVDYAPGHPTQERIKNVAQRTFFDELRDVLWANCGDQLIEMQQQAMTQSPPSDERQLDIDFDDEIEF